VQILAITSSPNIIAATILVPSTRKLVQSQLSLLLC
jgi:hypothetical protein